VVVVVGVVVAAVVVVYIYPLFSGPAAPYLFVRTYTCTIMVLEYTYTIGIAVDVYHGTMLWYVHVYKYNTDTISKRLHGGIPTRTHVRTTRVRTYTCTYHCQW
jgi:hypothetical protein